MGILFSEEEGHSVCRVVSRWPCETACALNRPHGGLGGLCTHRVPTGRAQRSSSNFVRSAPEVEMPLLMALVSTCQMIDLRSWLV